MVNRSVEGYDPDKIGDLFSEEIEYFPDDVVDAIIEYAGGLQEAGLLRAGIVQVGASELLGHTRTDGEARKTNTGNEATLAQ